MIDFNRCHQDRPRLAAPVAVILVLGLIGGCQSLPNPPQSNSSESGANSSSGTTQNQPPASLRQFTDIPIPVNADQDKDATMIFGSGDAWIGRLVFSTSTDSFDLFQQYRQTFPQFGWREVTSLRSKVSIITYMRGNRVATVQVEPSALYGSRVEISVSPRGDGGPRSQPATSRPYSRPNATVSPSASGGKPLIGPERAPYPQ